MDVFLPIAQVFVNPIEILLLSAIVGVLSGLFGVGGGFLLVHKSVINKLKKPFFKNVYNQEITKLFVSEDLYFSNKIKKAGEFIYLIPNIKCIHIKNINI